jgi:hypothetical protein
MKHPDILAAIDTLTAEVDDTTERIGRAYLDEAMESVRDLLDGAMGAYESEEECDPIELHYRAPGNRVGGQKGILFAVLCPPACQAIGAHDGHEAADLQLIGGCDYTRPGDELPEVTAVQEIWDRYHRGERGFSRHEVAYAGLPADAAWDASSMRSESAAGPVTASAEVPT